jgi:hypothetical protein
MILKEKLSPFSADRVGVGTPRPFPAAREADMLGNKAGIPDTKWAKNGPGENAAGSGVLARKRDEQIAQRLRAKHGTDHGLAHSSRPDGCRISCGMR